MINCVRAIDVQCSSFSISIEESWVTVDVFETENVSNLKGT